MDQIRRNAGFVALLVIILLVVLFAQRLKFNPCLLLSLPPPLCERTPAPTATPSPTPTPKVSPLGIRALAELTTVEYLAVAEVYNERVPDDIRRHLGVKEQILLIVYGNVRAGFDLEKLAEEDIWVDGSRVQLHLPAPEILTTSIDHKRSHVVYYQGSLLVAHDVNLEKDALEMAEDAIRQAAMEAGVLEKATKYGQLFFENYLRSLGFTEVQVVVD